MIYMIIEMHLLSMFILFNCIIESYNNFFYCILVQSEREEEKKKSVDMTIKQS